MESELEKELKERELKEGLVKVLGIIAPSSSLTSALFIHEVIGLASTGVLSNALVIYTFATALSTLTSVYSGYWFVKELREYARNHDSSRVP